VHAENDHARRSIELLRSGGDLDSVEFRHADIEDEQIRPMLFGQANGFETVRCLRHDRLTRLLQQAPQSSAHDAMIISQQHAQEGSP